MILWIIIGIILIITGAVVIISSPDETPIQTPTPAPTPPGSQPPPTSSSSSPCTNANANSNASGTGITYCGPTWQDSPLIRPHPNTQWSMQDPNVPLYEIYYYNNYSLPFRLTFPAGTTRVKVKPSGIGVQNFSVVEFKPAVNETTRDVSIPYQAALTPTTGYVLFQLLLNDNTTPSASSNRWFINHTQ